VSAHDGTGPLRSHDGSASVGPIRGNRLGPFSGNQVGPIPGNRVGSIRGNSAVGRAGGSSARVGPDAFLRALERLGVTPWTSSLSAQARSVACRKSHYWRVLPQLAP
jgi:hypothetical protein